MSEDQSFEDAYTIPDLTEMDRLKWFAGLQLLFFIGSPFAGGFHNELWSMLDSALLVISFGITGLVIVLPTQKYKKRAFYIAVVFYVLAVIDIAINILLTGWVGWAKFTD